ncbi:hypothetical protein DPMN_160539 [Dreissena polymorpha]|uniref:Uncharacterized protein n=1 Tax=Dreissena polymorpha TaxID=45954 RepID=A0A9D4EMF3_DREPO|nr:hypothetical protein DPMN_160539 [Dreissena polymorpha]
MWEEICPNKHYIVISDSEETQPPSPFVNRNIPVKDQLFNSLFYKQIPDYWLHIQTNFWVLRLVGGNVFQTESCLTIQLQGHLT